MGLLGCGGQVASWNEEEPRNRFQRCLSGWIHLCTAAPNTAFPRKAATVVLVFSNEAPAGGSGQASYRLGPQHLTFAGLPVQTQPANWHGMGVGSSDLEGQTGVRELDRSADVGIAAASSILPAGPRSAARGCAPADRGALGATPSISHLKGRWAACLLGTLAQPGVESSRLGKDSGRDWLPAAIPQPAGLLLRSVARRRAGVDGAESLAAGLVLL